MSNSTCQFWNYKTIRLQFFYQLLVSCTIRPLYPFRSNVTHFLDTIKKFFAYFFSPSNGPQNIRFNNGKAVVNLAAFPYFVLVNKLRTTFQARRGQATVSRCKGVMTDDQLLKNFRVVQKIIKFLARTSQQFCLYPASV